MILKRRRSHDQNLFYLSMNEGALIQKPAQSKLVTQRPYGLRNLVWEKPEIKSII
ncbi:MAG: hypothetical protein ACI837_000907 [Crocinitomicaceae bacterium]|jgi:hypothetical protein